MRTELMNLVAFHDKELITTSSIVARVFGKRHADVLRAIEKITKQSEQLLELERKSAFELPGYHLNFQVIPKLINPKLDLYPRNNS